MTASINDVFELFEPFFAGIVGSTTKKPRGRPLAASTIAIRKAILDLQQEQRQMTVRGVFYALTVRGVVDKTENGYRQVQRQALHLRREGQLPWGFIADGTRWVREPETWDSTEDALRETARTYRRNLWREQRCRIEIWLEKDALASLVADVTYKWGVRLMVSRGQASDTYCYSAAQDARCAWEDAGIETFVYMLYDSDRAGRVAAGKIEEKLRRYSGDAPITCELLAVTDDQIEDWDLPTRPAKENAEEIAVELDAIPPNQLTSIVDEAIRWHVDPDAWAMAEKVEASEREIILRLIEGAA